MTATYTGTLGTVARVATDHPAVAAMYLLEMNQDAPTFFRFHGLGVLSLATMPGIHEPKKRYPEAQWQLVAFTIDADCVRPTTENMRIWQRVTPEDVDLHFHGIDAGQCAALALFVAMYCADGDVPIEPGRVANAEAIWKTGVRRAIDSLIAGIPSVPRPQAVM